MSICPMCEKRWEGWAGAALETRVYFKGYDIHLSNMEARLAAALIQTNRALSREYLFDVMWGDDPSGGPETADENLKVHLSRLRKKFSKLAIGIKNIHGSGYTAVNTKSLSGFPSLKIMAYALLIPLFLSFPILAVAQSICADNDDITTMLQGKYGEERVSVAFTQAGKLMERYENPKNGTWTLIVHPDGSHACIFATGTDWHDKKVSSVPEA